MGSKKHHLLKRENYTDTFARVIDNRDKRLSENNGKDCPVKRIRNHIRGIAEYHQTRFHRQRCLFVDGKIIGAKCSCSPYGYMPLLFFGRGEQVAGDKFPAAFRDFGTYSFIILLTEQKRRIRYMLDLDMEIVPA